ncbi:hypothetical protein BHU72_13065 [Desulfuribacillus stibiiarsenatis]|uniref:ATP-grasp domain-containing protein n=1 Tax=Desulfuribacillus stibiiarsenatis TaxID=1390249 RepID=A0A1E5L928_9FIRM|nr:YheC/YheD family protein [Desulfuribacillus stibiiarsenatis]OEH86534.1 hypothetical protein BHU72_13065 [Desulfuribacillus stibiiarsenatis]
MTEIKHVQLRLGTNEYAIIEFADSTIDKFSEGKHIIHVGQKKLLVLVKKSTTKTNSNILYLNQLTFHKLQLPENIVLTLRYEKGVILLGPILGIFTTSDDIEELLRGKADNAFMDLEFRKRGQGLYYFFTTKDICWSTQSVNAYFWDKERRWKRQQFPLPDIIYDSSFGKDAAIESYGLRAKIIENKLDIRVLNDPIVLCIEEVFQHLNSEAIIREHLQPSVPLATFLDNPFILQALLQKTPDLKWNSFETIIKISSEKSTSACAINDDRYLNSKDVIDYCFPYQSSSILEACKALSQQVAKIIEIHFGTILELELDFGIDATGKVWLLRVNSNPSKQSFLLRNNPSVMNRVIQLPILTCFSFAGFIPTITVPTKAYPTFGLAVSKKVWNRIDKNALLKDKALLAQSKGLSFYCFKLSNVNWDHNLVEAYDYNPLLSGWIKKQIPVPDVIQYRGGTPTLEDFNNPTCQGKVFNIQWINATKVFGKWETYKALRFFEKTTAYLPETTLLTLSNLQQYLQKHAFCYIKSNSGKCGYNVFRIERGINGYLCKAGGSMIQIKNFTDLKGLFEFLIRTIGKDGILQQGINLAQMNNCPFDMRVLVQKNGHCEWIVSALNYRIGAPNAVVTNFAAGATDILKIPGEKLLQCCLTWEALTEISLDTVYALESYFGRIGEVGLDIGLDIHGKLWIIEANSRPSSIAYRNATSETRQNIFGMPFDYAIASVQHM